MPVWSRRKVSASISVSLLSSSSNSPDASRNPRFAATVKPAADALLLILTLGKVLAHTRHRVVDAAVVDQNHLDRFRRHALDAPQTRRRKVAGIVRWNDDRERDAHLEYSGGDWSGGGGAAMLAQ